MPPTRRWNSGAGVPRESSLPHPGLTLRRAVTPIPTSQSPTPARRPAHSVLASAKLERVFGLRLPDWDVALAQCLESPVEGFERLRFVKPAP